MSDSKRPGPLGLTGVHSVELCVYSEDSWLRYLTEGFGFQHTARSTAQYEARTGTRTHTLQCDDIRVILMQGLDDRSPVKAYLDRHPEGISHVNLGVGDLDHTTRLLAERPATFIDDMQTEKVNGSTFRHTSIATALGDVTYRFVEVEGSPDIVPGQERIKEFDPHHNPLGITEIDHLTSNVRTLQPLISWYEEVMGFERFWKVRFHTDDLKPGTGTGLKSIVVWDADSKKVKLANNEPLRPRFDESQIQIYVDQNRGPGVQHIAFHVRDIMTCVDHCVANNIEFLPTPRTYYEMVPGRIERQGMGTIKESLAEIEKRSILIDGERGGYLLQIFCKDQAAQFNDPKAGPLFIEIIQRCGCDGFGEGNFRALFESIEREQQGA